MIRKLVKMAKLAGWMLPGFVLWASFPPMAERLDSLFALAPLLWLSRRANARRATLIWFANGVLFWVGSLSWMPAIVSNGGPWPLVLLGWFLLALYCALYFAAFGYLSARVWLWAALGGYGRRLAAILLAEPILWAGLELLRSRLLGGFAWNHLGVPATVAGFGAPAAIGGVFLVSALVLLVNGTFASIADRMLANLNIFNKTPADIAVSRVPKYLRSIETFLPLVFVWLCFNVARFPSATNAANVQSAAPSKALTVALVQRNHPCVFSGKRENPYTVYSSLLSNVSMLRPDMIILPESALSEIGQANSLSIERFISWLRQTTAARGILAGGVRIDEKKREYNSALLYTDDKVDYYDKAHLVPFGEFIPGDKLFPFLQRFAPVGSCWPGELKTLDFEGIKLGVAICYEDTDSAQIRELARMGARLLVFITNDTWFAYSQETLQHSWQSIARAIETGLPVARVGNSGVTGTISPDGKPTWLSGTNGSPIVDRTGTMVERIELPTPRRTLYVILGDWPLAVLFALILLALLARRIAVTRLLNRQDAAEYGKI